MFFNKTSHILVLFPPIEKNNEKKKGFRVPNKKMKKKEDTLVISLIFCLAKETQKFRIQGG